MPGMSFNPGVVRNFNEFLPVASLKFQILFAFDKVRYGEEWRRLIVSRIEDRLLHPRFGFPGVFDRAPPPPKTLHWRYAPAEGEYQKIKAILCWGTLHAWMLSRRLSGSPQHLFLIDGIFDHFSNELTAKWLPEASIPSFSIKSEGKQLVEWCRSVSAELDRAESDDKLLDVLWEYGYSNVGIQRSDPILLDLLGYIRRQQELLSMDVKELLTRWAWDDSIV